LCANTVTPPADTTREENMPRSIKTRRMAGLVCVIAVILAAILIIVADNFRQQSRKSSLHAAHGEMRQLDYAIQIFLDDCLASADMLAMSPAAKHIDEVTTNFLATTQKSVAAVWQGDQTGRNWWTPC
jgi:methyl-accepting chemotaxis protein